MSSEGDDPSQTHTFKLRTMSLGHGLQLNASKMSFGLEDGSIGKKKKG